MIILNRNIGDVAIIEGGIRITVLNVQDRQVYLGISTKNKGNTVNVSNQENALTKIPCWVLMLNEIKNIMGFSFTHIAYRIGCSPSSVQKLVKDYKRVPRDEMFFNLACFYYKLFYSTPKLSGKGKNIEEKHDETLYQVVIELINRGFLDDSYMKANEQTNGKKCLDTVLRSKFLGNENITERITLQKNIFPSCQMRF